MSQDAFNVLHDVIKDHHVFHNYRAPGGKQRLKRANWASVHKSAYCAHLRISTKQMRAIYVNCALLCANACYCVHWDSLLGANGIRIARAHLRT